MLRTSRLSFGFAQSEQVALDGDKLLIGPDATSMGLREGIRRGGVDLTPIRLDAESFALEIEKLYQSGNDGAADTVSFDLSDTANSDAAQRDLVEDGSGAPVVRLVNQTLRKAVQLGASDVHFEPHESGLRVRLRLDGFLQPHFDRGDVPVARVVSRLKVMASLDIAETRLPQDGRIELFVGGRAIDARVSTLPGSYGERVVLRILDRNAGLMPLAELGLEAERTAVLERLSSRPDGIILATGPTGSGKTTTLYSMLKLANRDERNLITVEDPIEYNVKGLNQTQINSEIGMTFAAGLRAALRQDPDVIFVGEIRDGETASIAGQAALTGHLVFSSLHSNTAVGAVTRMRDLGAEDYLIAATLRGVIAQRLLRRLCTKCATDTSLTEGQRARFADAHLSAPDCLRLKRGCDACNGSGYRGRIGIYDIVEINEELRIAIDGGANESELRKLGEAQSGTLTQEALARVAEGVTDLAELDRVVGDGQ